MFFVCLVEIVKLQLLILCVVIAEDPDLVLRNIIAVPVGPAEEVEMEVAVEGAMSSMKGVVAAVVEGG